MKTVKLLFFILLILNISCNNKKYFIPLNNISYDVIVIFEFEEIFCQDDYCFYIIYFIPKNELKVPKIDLFNKKEMKCLNVKIGNAYFNYFFRSYCKKLKWIDKDGKYEKNLVYMPLRIKFSVPKNIENLYKNNKLIFNEIPSAASPMYFINGHKIIINQYFYIDENNVIDGHIDISSYETLE